MMNVFIKMFNGKDSHQLFVEDVRTIRLTSEGSFRINGVAWTNVSSLIVTYQNPLKRSIKR